MEEEVLKSLNFQFTQLLYSTSNVKVYSGTYYGFPAVFKVLVLPPDVEYQVLEKESQILLRINHENIVKIYNYQWVEWHSVWYLVIVMEACDKDLAKDLYQRNKNTYPYSESELWNMMITLVRAFAYMQKQGLAHRDIKPENIFLSHGILKVGDFGVARYLTTDQATATVTGTPFYLSPLLKQGLIDRKKQVVHNVYKSDVYSLGLTFLALALRQPPLVAIHGEDAIIKSTVWTLSYSEDIRRLILWMLEHDEGNRPDFNEMENWITATYFSQLPSSTLSKPQSDSNKTKNLSPPTAIEVLSDSSGKDEIKNSTQLSIEQSIESQKPHILTKQSPPRERARAFPREEHKSDDPLCMKCNCLVRMVVGSPVVQLRCSPNKHVYCSPECLSSSYKEQKKLRNEPWCPICRTPIDEDDLRCYCVQIDEHSFPLPCGLDLFCSLFSRKTRKYQNRGS